MSLAPALDAATETLRTPAGEVALYSAPGPGRPLLLIHSVNAAASAYEVRPLFEALRGRRPVYALDLPGFGLSDRSDRAYLPRLMTDAVLAIAQEVRRRHAGAKLDALALSLSCEYLARGCVEQPALFNTLALVSPTGLKRSSVAVRGPMGSNCGIPWLMRFLRRAAVGRRAFALLTRPAVIRYFLRRTWGSKRIDEGLWAFDLKTVRQPGAAFAPFHFLSGYLFSRDAAALYAALELPIWVVHGVRGDFTDYGYARRVALRVTRP